MALIGHNIDKLWFAFCEKVWIIEILIKAKSRLKTDTIEIYFQEDPSMRLTSRLIWGLTKFDGSSFFVKSQSAVINFCHLTSFYCWYHHFTETVLAQIFKSIWRSNAWMDPLEIFFLLYQFLLYFLQFKSFPPWMACFNSNINDLDFVPKDKSKLVKIVANWGHSQWKQLNLQKIE